MNSGRRRVLLSCFACSPQLGSEPGVGWHWLIEMAKRHDVTVVTHSYFRDHIEPVLQANPLAGVTVEYFAPIAFGAHPHRQLNSRIYYIWWQLRVRRLARRLLSRESFDLVHHLTWGTVRFPCFLGGLGVALVMGPLGGGETGPLSLYRGLPLATQLFEWVRTVSIALMRVDPLAMAGPKRAALVLCRTEETLRCLPEAVRSRACLVPDVGAPEITARDCGRRPRGGRARLLFAGRLLGLKGVAHAIEAVGHLHAAGYELEFAIAGDGPLRKYLETRIRELGIGARVILHGKLPRQDLFELYRASDLFLFPSLHDAGGSVVLEALSCGLPVVCLDLGGPKNFVTERCGAVVATRGRSRQEVERALAQTVAALIDDPARLAAMSGEAQRHAAAQSWECLVKRGYDLIEQRLGLRGGSLPGAKPHAGGRTPAIHPAGAAREQ
jgi:glycosyltransferase involved in cell wall biosynthesis